jgi:hypothetical protein
MTVQNIGSESWCRKAYLNYHCQGNTMGLTPNDMGEITNAWNNKLGSWQTSVSSDETEYDFDDSKYANNFDHFSFDQDEFMGVYARATRPNVIDKYCKRHGDQKFSYYKKNVSDHLPISLNINLNNQNVEWEK